MGMAAVFVLGLSLRDLAKEGDQRGCRLTRGRCRRYVPLGRFLILCSIGGFVCELRAQHFAFC